MKLTIFYNLYIQKDKTLITATCRICIIAKRGERIMAVEDIKNIAVIGAGNMGHQLAVLCALNGFRTICMTRSTERLDSAEKFFEQYVSSRVSKQKMTKEAAQQAAENIIFTRDLKKAVQDADFVIEAIVDKIDIKREVFAEIDSIAPSHAILTTNSSYIVSSKIADATKRPDKVCNMHFFNPALVMQLVEVVKGPHVSEETALTTYALSEKLGKLPVMLNKEVEGFLTNRIIRAIRLEAYWLLDMGVADVADIDRAVELATGSKMGPFRRNDLTGLDLSLIHAVEKFQETGDLKDMPSPSLVKKVSEGKYGKKTGEGWYKYE
jgi:3-hydroxybutyryl-CoA dehydrogenase